MVDEDASCPDVMSRSQPVQGVLGASRLVLRKHLETCVADGVRPGRTDLLLDGLMEALWFDGSITRPSGHVAW
jgi:DNA-binding FrmR family transcriptional regulator